METPTCPSFTQNQDEMATANVFLKTSKLNKAGEAPLKILIYNKGKKREKSLGLRVRPDQWDSEKKRVKKNHPQSTRLNKLIAKEKSKYLGLAMELESGEKSLSHGSIDQITNRGGNMDLVKLVEEKAEGFKQMGKMNSYQSYFYTASRLRWFMEFMGMTKLEVCDLKREVRYPGTGERLILIDAYMKFLAVEKGNSSGTVRVGTNTIRSVLNDKIKKDLLDPVHKPFFKLPKAPSRIAFLTQDQLTELGEYSLPQGSVSDLARDMYLFSSLGGGLRYSDIVTLKWSHIEKGGRLNKRTLKTGSRVQMNLGKVPLEILAKYRRVNTSPTDFVFPVLPADFDTLDAMLRHQNIRRANCRTNGPLARIARQMGIKHTMSFHTARHTFATMAVSKGMKITVLQKILGHSSITQTEKYWHLLGKDLDEEVERFNSQIQNLGSSGHPEPPQSKSEGKDVPPIRDTQTKMVRFYAEQTARMHFGDLSEGIEGIIVNPIDLDAFAREMAFPEVLRKQTEIRLFAFGESVTHNESLKNLESTLNRGSLFGESVKFTVLPALPEWVEKWTDMGIRAAV